MRDRASAFFRDRPGDSSADALGLEVSFSRRYRSAFWIAAPPASFDSRFHLDITDKKSWCRPGNAPGGVWGVGGGGWGGGGGGVFFCFSPLLGVVLFLFFFFVGGVTGGGVSSHLLTRQIVASSATRSFKWMSALRDLDPLGQTRACSPC